MHSTGTHSTCPELICSLNQIVHIYITHCHSVYNVHSQVLMIGYVSVGSEGRKWLRSGDER